MNTIAISLFSVESRKSITFTCIVMNPIGVTVSNDNALETMNYIYLTKGPATLLQPEELFKCLMSGNEAMKKQMIYGKVV